VTLRFETEEHRNKDRKIVYHGISGRDPIQARGKKKKGTHSSTKKAGTTGSFMESYSRGRFLIGVCSRQGGHTLVGISPGLKKEKKRGEKKS